MPARPPIELSYTHSKDLTCGHRFQQLVVNQESEHDFEESIFGSLHHEGAALYGIHLAGENRKTDPPIYDQIIDNLISKFSPSVQAQIIEESGSFRENYVQAVDVDEHQFEHRLAVKWPSLEPCDPSLPLKVTGDRIAGTPDHVWFTEDRTRGDVEDYKFGKGRRVSYDSASKDKQIKTYCWLALLNFPTLQYINGRLWTVLWGMNATSSFEFGPHNRQGLHDDMVKAYGADFKTADDHWKKNGKKPWPAKGGEVCNWCKLPGDPDPARCCPKYAQYIKSYRINGVEEAPIGT